MSSDVAFRVGLGFLWALVALSGGALLICLVVSCVMEPAALVVVIPILLFAIGMGLIQFAIWRKNNG